MNTSKFVAPNTVFDSSVAFLRNTTFDSSVYLQGVTHISDPSISVAGTPYALVVESIGTDVEIKAKQLGTMAFETSTNYYSKPEVDGIVDNLESSIGALRAKDASQDASIAALDLYVQDLSTRIGTIDDWQTYVDGSLNRLIAKDASQDASINALDLLTQQHTSDIANVSTNKLDAVANINVVGDASLFSYETGTVAYLKKLLAGSGIVITEDTSTITIAGDFASTVAKYTNTFSGVGSASLGILESTHNLGAGPLDVTVYENNQAVYPDIDCDANGNIVINWAPGSLGANCKYVIMG